MLALKTTLYQAMRLYTPSTMALTGATSTTPGRPNSMPAARHGAALTENVLRSNNCTLNNSLRITRATRKASAPKSSFATPVKAQAISAAATQLTPATSNLAGREMLFGCDEPSSTRDVGAAADCPP